MKAIAVLATTAAAAAAVAFLVHRRRKRLLRAAAACESAALTPIRELVKPLQQNAKEQPPAAMSTPTTKPPAASSPLTEGASRVMEQVRDDNKTEGASRVMKQVRDDNKRVVRAWEKAEWEKARARIEANQTKIKEREEMGERDPVKEYSKQLLEARRSGLLTEERVGQAEAEAETGGLDRAASRGGERPAGASAQKGSTAGATAASIAAELRRWPRPPSGMAGCQGELVLHEWPLYYDHFDWLDEVARAYAFADAGEALRHLIFVANGESAQVKKLIFKVIRCLHCHSGTRAGHIPKKPKQLAVFDFQQLWLLAVHKQCDHPSVEKSVRVLLDYYRKLTSDKPGAEAELFWRHRTDVTLASFEAHLPGVPGNYFLGRAK